MTTSLTDFRAGAPTVAVQRCVAALGAGRMVVVIDDEDRENEGDLVVAAECVTDQQMAFIVRNTTGIVCTPMPAARADALRLPPMVVDNQDEHRTAFTVSVDAAGTGTGVSAADRARTVATLAASDTTPAQLSRPGHVFPLRACVGGVLVRAGHTEAAVDLVTMAGLSGVAVISELVDDDGSMRRGASLAAFAAEHDLPVLTIADLVRHRLATERQVHLESSARMPTEFGDFRALAYRNEVDGTEHLALVMGDVAGAGKTAGGVLVRVHSECLTGDILGSLRCDCGAQLEQALRAVDAEGCGVVVYLRGHEGRGIGLAHKIRASELQDGGLDTVDANSAQGLPVDSRSYGVGAQILADLGVRRLRLITNNMAKYGGLEGYGLEIVDRVSLPTAVTPHNVRYLRTKRDRLGHRLLPAGSEAQDSSRNRDVTNAVRSVARIEDRLRVGPDEQVDDRAVIIMPDVGQRRPTRSPLLSEDWFSSPGFEWHPDRGIETVTLVLDGVRRRAGGSTPSRPVERGVGDRGWRAPS